MDANGVGNRRLTTAPLEDAVWAPSPGAYLTDGGSLFRVEHALSDSLSGELFLELEDCRTMEMVLCPARVVTASGLRSVTPTSEMRDG